MLQFRRKIFILVPDLWDMNFDARTISTQEFAAIHRKAINFMRQTLEEFFIMVKTRKCMMYLD